MRRALTLLVLCALLLTFTGCSPLGGDKMKVTALMSDSAGLFVGNDVGILGVPVGTVTSIEPEGTHVRVTMEVDADQPVPADAGAVVVARSVATDRYVELTPVYHSGPKMKSGAVIQQPRTRTPVDFDTVLEALNTLATGIAGKGETADAIGRILRAGSKALKGKGSTLNQSITALARAVNSVSGQRGNITGTLKSLDALTQVIAANQGTVRTFIDQVARASDMLASERENFRTAMRSLSAAVQLVAQFAKDNRKQLTTSLDRSTALMRSLLKNSADIKDVLRVMPLALQNLQQIYDNGYVRVMIDPTVLTPLGGLVQTVCALPVLKGTCSLVGPQLLDLQTVLGKVLDNGGLVGGLLGGVQ